MKLWFELNNKELVEGNHDPIHITTIHSFDLPVQNFSIEMKLLLENKGEAAARWVKIAMVIDDDGIGEKGKVGILSTEEPGWGSFYKLHGTPGYYSRIAFNGGNDFISYSHSVKDKNLQDVTDDLGKIQLVIPSGEPPKENTIKLRCTLEASEGGRNEQTFVFKTIPPDNSEMARLSKELWEKLPESTKAIMRKVKEIPPPNIFRHS